MEFAESKAASSSNSDFNPGSYGQSAPAPSQAADGFMNIPTGLEEELPFQ